VNVLSDLRVSVGRTWLFSTQAGAPTVSADNRGYRDVVKGLQGGTSGTGPWLPWPPYRSRFWGYLFGDYLSTSSYDLVGGLLPLHRGLSAPEYVTSASGAALMFVDSSEAFLHPFAVTTLLHLRLEGEQPWQTDSQAAAFLDDLMRARTDPQSPGQVRDGVPVTAIAGLPAQDADGQAAGYRQAREFAFTLLSGRHQDGDSAADSYRLASLYRKQASDKSRPMNTQGSAISVTDRCAGMLMPAQSMDDQRIACVHHNMATLLAYLQNLGAVLPGQPTESCKWFRARAALLLNHLYRRAPLPDIQGIYKSRLAGMWIDHLGLSPSINQVNAQAAAPPPDLPAAAP
jgi:hypothetical protein